MYLYSEMTGRSIFTVGKYPEDSMARTRTLENPRGRLGMLHGKLSNDKFLVADEKLVQWLRGSLGI